MTAKIRIPIGIDFGTSNSSVAMVVPDAQGRPKPKALDLGNGKKIPTAVFFTEEGKTIVGDDATKMGRNNPQRLYTEFKRNLDENFPLLRSLPGNVSVSANDLAEYVINYLMENAEKQDGDSDKAVVCHPVGDPWQSILKKIITRLGKKAHLLTEPEAVLYYAHYLKHIFNERSETILLIDFGGGTCDFLLARVKATLWNGFVKPDLDVVDEDRLNFGGKDIDQLIADKLIKKWLSENPKRKKLGGEFSSPEEFWKIKNEAKELKELLSRNYTEGIYEALPIQVTNLPGNTILETSVTPEELGLMVSNEITNQFKWMLLGDDQENKHSPLLGRTGVKPEDVTMVILAGGSSQLPWLREQILPIFFPRLALQKRIYLLDEPEMAVSYGAALYAGDLFTGGKAKLPRFIFEDLRVELEDGNTYLLAERGSQLPIKKDSKKGTHFFRFPKNGKTLPVQLIAGGDHRAVDCRQLSSEARLITFIEDIREGTLMELKVEVDLKGEVRLYISKAFPLWGKKEVCELFFQPLEITAIQEAFDEGRNS